MKKCIKKEPRNFRALFYLSYYNYDLPNNVALAASEFGRIA